MKAKKTKITLALILGVILLSACFSPFSGEEETGIVTITIPGTSQARWTAPTPDSAILDELTHVIHFRRDGNTLIPDHVIGPGGTRTFNKTVPIGPLDIEVIATLNGYNFAHATVSGSVIANETNNFPITMNRLPYGIILSISGNPNFGTQAESYGPIAPITVTVQNFAENDTGPLTVAVPTGFETSATAPLNSLLALTTPISSTTFTVNPQHALSGGSYSGQVRVYNTANGIDISFNVNFTVESLPAYNIAFATGNIVETGGGAIQGVTGTMASMTDIQFGDTVSLTNIGFSRAGFTFAGWSTTPGGALAHADGASVTNLTVGGTVNPGDTVTLYARWTFAYNIGGTGPAGGVIFYVDPAGFAVQGAMPGIGAWPFTYIAYYLEAWTSNEAAPPIWGGSGTLVAGVTTFTSPTDPEASLIGNGRRDTSLIVAFMDSSIPPIIDTAAHRASVSRGSFNDWFLPSLGELNQLFINSAAVDAGGSALGANFFWSSSQSNATEARSQLFSNGSQGSSSKSLNYHVRAVRAF